MVKKIVILSTVFSPLFPSNQDTIAKITDMAKSALSKQAELSKLFEEKIEAQQIGEQNKQQLNDATNFLKTILETLQKSPNTSLADIIEMFAQLKDALVKKDADFSALQKELENLKKANTDVAGVQSELAKRDELIKFLEDALNKIDQSLQQPSGGDLTTLESTVDQIVEFAFSLLSENQNLKSQLNDLQNAQSILDGLKQHLLDLQNRINALSVSNPDGAFLMKVKELLGLVGNLQGKIASLSKELQDEKAAHGTLNSKSSDLEKQIGDLQNLLASLEADFQAISTALDGAKSKFDLTALEKIIDELIKNLTDQNANLKTTLQEQQQAIDDLHAKLEQKDAGAGELSKTNQEQQAKITALQDEVNKYQVQIAGFTGTLQKISDSLKTVGSAQHKPDLTEVENIVDKILELWAQRVEQLLQQIDDLNNQLDGNNQNLASLKQKLDQANADLVKAQKDMKDAQLQAGEAERLKGEMGTQPGRANAQNTDLQNQNQNMRSQLDQQLYQMMQIAANLANNLKSEFNLRSVEQTVDELIRLLQNQIDQLEQMLRAKDQTIAGLREAANSTGSQKDQKIAELQGNIEDLNNQINQANQKIKDLQANLDDLQTQFDQMTDSQTDATKAKQAEIDRLNKQISDQQEANRQKDNQIMQMRETIARLQTENQSLMGQIDMLKKFMEQNKQDQTMNTMLQLLSKQSSTPAIINNDRYLGSGNLGSGNSSGQGNGQNLPTIVATPIGATGMMTGQYGYAGQTGYGGQMMPGQYGQAGYAQQGYNPNQPYGQNYNQQQPYNSSQQPYGQPYSDPNQYNQTGQQYETISLRNELDRADKLLSGISSLDKRIVALETRYRI